VYAFWAGVPFGHQVAYPVAINGEKLAERDWRDTVVVPQNEKRDLPLSLSGFQRAPVRLRRLGSRTF
jgi:hypothetical protein